MREKMSKDKEISLDATASFLFTAMMKCCVTVKELGLGKNKFMEFCEESWNSMEMNDPEILKDALSRRMQDDLKKFGIKYSYDGKK